RPGHRGADHTHADERPAVDLASTADPVRSDGHVLVLVAHGPPSFVPACELSTIYERPSGGSNRHYDGAADGGGLVERTRERSVLVAAIPLRHLEAARERCATSG